MRVPTRRWPVAVCVALLLVVAGCGGTTAPTDTATPSGTATTTGSPSETPTETRSEGQYPPGVDDDGDLADVTALLDAHEAETADRTVGYSYQWSGPASSAERRYVRRANGTAYRSVFNRTIGEDSVSEEFYWSDGRGYSRFRFDNQTRYAVVQNTTELVTAWTHATGGGGPRAVLQVILSAGNYSVDGTVERDGRTFVRLTATEPDSSVDHSTEYYDGTVLVTPAGVVYSVDATYGDEAGSGVTERATMSLELTTDVEWAGTPAWIDELPRLAISTVEDGRTLAIQNTGGTALPANVTFVVAVADVAVDRPFEQGVTGTVATTGPLAPGDIRYVTVDGEASSPTFTLHDDPTQGEYAIRAAGIQARHGNVTYWLATGVDRDNQ